MNTFLYWLKLFPWIFGVLFILLNGKDFLNCISVIWKKQEKKRRKPFTVMFMIIILVVLKGLDFVPRTDALKIPEKIFNILLIVSESLMLLMFIVWLIISSKKKPRIPFTKTFIQKGHPFDDFLLLSIWISLMVTSFSFFVVHPPIDKLKEAYEKNDFFEKYITDEYKKKSDIDKLTYVYKPISFEEITDVQSVKIFNNKKKIFCFVNFNYANNKLINSLMPPGEYYACLYSINEKSFKGVVDLIQGNMKMINDSDSTMYVINENDYLPIYMDVVSHRIKVKSCQCNPYNDGYSLFPNDMIIVKTSLRMANTVNQNSTKVNISSILITSINNDTAYYSEMIQNPMHQIPVYLKMGDYIVSLFYDEEIKQKCSFNLSIINDTISRQDSTLVFTNDRIINFMGRFYEFWESQIYIGDEIEKK